MDHIYLGGSTVRVDDEWCASLYGGVVSGSGTGARLAYSMVPRYIGADIHADVHALVFTPGRPDELWVGCDGGLFYTANASAATPTFEARNLGLGTLTMEFLGFDPKEEAVLFCGAQDNGTLRYTGEEAWLHVGRGDGGCVVVNWHDPTRVLRGYAYSVVWRADDGGQGYDSWHFAPVPLVPGEQVEFYPPLVGTPPSDNPAAADLLAFGSERPWISTDFGVSWRSIPDGTLEADRLGIAHSDGSQDRITALAFASDTRLFAGTKGGWVYRFDRSDSGWSSRRISGAGAARSLPLALPITCITVDPADRYGNSIYVTLGGWGDYRHLWRWDGKQWEDRSGSQMEERSRLLDVQHNTVVVDPLHTQTLYAGADIGVWQSMDGGKHWSVFADGLPDSAVLDLKLHPAARVLLASTHGRGVYEYKLDTATAAGVELYLRMDRWERGRRPAGDPRSTLRSPDIKVGEPAQKGSQSSDRSPNFYDFVDRLMDRESLSRPDTATERMSAPVYVLVHNRGGETAEHVHATLLVADATAGLPDLPAGYGDKVRTGTPVIEAGWQTVGAQMVQAVRVDLPRVAVFELPLELLPSAEGDATPVICLLALLHCPETDEFLNNERSVTTLVAGDRKAALTTLRLVVE